jgi:hypothetical protein
MNARDMLATRSKSVTKSSRHVWVFLGSLGVVVTVSSGAFAQPAPVASAPAADKAKPKAETPQAETPKAESKAAPNKVDVLPGDLDEPAAPASPEAPAAGGWLDGAGDKNTAQPKPEATAAPEAPAAAATPAPAVEPTESKKPEVAKVAPSEPRIRYALPQSTEKAKEPEPTDYETLPLGRHQDHWFFGTGFRGTWIDDENFDPFNEKGALAQFSVSAGRTAYVQEKLSFAVSGMLDIGSTEATARSMSSEFRELRLGLGLEGRYHVRSWFYGYARVAPGAVRTWASLEASQGLTYEAGEWSPSVDGALGAAVRIIGTRDGRKHGPRVWLFAEGGYAWVGTQDLTLEATGADAPLRAEPIELGELDLSGTTMRLGVHVAF